MRTWRSASRLVRAGAVTVAACGFVPAQDVGPSDAGSGVPAALLFGKYVLVEANESLVPSQSVPFAELGMQLVHAWFAGSLPGVLAVADGLIEARPSDPRGHILKYLAHLDVGQDRAAATRTAHETLKALGRHPRALAEFVLEGLLSQPTVNEYQTALMAIVPLLAEGAEVPAVRIAHVRALIGCGKAKEALLIYRGIVEDLAGSPSDLVRLAHAVCDTPGGEALSELARRACDLAAPKLGGGEAARLLRYRVLRLQGLDAEAAALGAEIVAAHGGSTSVNPWLWYLVLDRKTRGRYTSLAGLAGQRILDVSPSSYDRDTAALGLFVAGRHEAALAAQEGSLATAAGSATPGMARRLHIYREVVAGERAAAAQRVAAPRGAKTRRDGR